MGQLLALRLHTCSVVRLEFWRCSHIHSSMLRKPSNPGDTFVTPWPYRRILCISTVDVPTLSFYLHCSTFPSCPVAPMICDLRFNFT